MPETLIGRFVHRVFHNGEQTPEEGDKQFSPEQVQEIAWYVYYEPGRKVPYVAASDAVMGNDSILEALRSATVEEIREQRGMTTGKQPDELTVLGRKFLEDHLGPEEADRISRLLDRKE